MQKQWELLETQRKSAEARKGGISDSELRELERTYGVYPERNREHEEVHERYMKALENGSVSASIGAEEGTELLRAVKGAQLGDPESHRRLFAEGKGWVEGTDASGGYLVKPEQLPGYIAARRAASPLRERCSIFRARSHEVWVVTEGNSITVAHTAEAATKTTSTGTVAQKVSTVHKAAGLTYVSDELLADSQGLVADLVGRQFATQTGIAIDSAIISGTGTGQPTGIRNAAGVTSTTVDGQGGKALVDSILKALSRLAVKFYSADSVVMNPRDAVKVDLATDANGTYIFPGGHCGSLPGRGDRARRQHPDEPRRRLERIPHHRRRLQGRRLLLRAPESHDRRLSRCRLRQR